MVRVCRPLTGIVVLAVLLHALGISRTILPAQDGLKYIRIANAFQTQPWSDVIRASDQHPLYPALIALFEPVVRAFQGRGPTTWQLTAQLVSSIAAVLLLFPLHAISCSLFNRKIADLAALGFVLLPFPMSVGHDTLSDSLALLGFASALMLGAETLRNGSRSAAIACGVVSGVGFLARPEVLVAPLAVLSVGALKNLRLPWTEARDPWIKLATLSIASLCFIGAYSLVKGEVSERLAIRESARLGFRAAPKPLKSAGHWLPAGLDDKRWDFSPKEEPAIIPTRRWRDIGRDLLHQWSDGLGTILAIFAVWGLVRDRYVCRFIEADHTLTKSKESGPLRWIIFAYLIFFSAILMRHEYRMGYLSTRHTLTLVMIALPWGAAGVYVCAVRLVRLLGFSPFVKTGLGSLALATAITTSVSIQAKAAHPTRWGHREAGLWLASHAKHGEALLDTRGWAAFVSTMPSYDYWHVRQALTDDKLTYVVVGQDELKASSARAATLRAWIGHAATPLLSFPEREGGSEPGVWVYRYQRPASWEVLKP